MFIMKTHLIVAQTKTLIARGRGLIKYTDKQFISEAVQGKNE